MVTSMTAGQTQFVDKDHEMQLRASGKLVSGTRVEMSLSKSELIFLWDDVETTLGDNCVVQGVEMHLQV